MLKKKQKADYKKKQREYKIRWKKIKQKHQKRKTRTQQIIKQTKKNKNTKGIHQKKYKIISIARRIKS